MRIGHPPVVERLVERLLVDTGVAVLAQKFYLARQAGERLLADGLVTWDEGPLAKLSSKDLFDDYAKTAHETARTFDERDELHGRLGGPKTITAEYRLPYLAHAAMEPINCTAHVTSDGCARHHRSSTSVQRPARSRSYAMIASEITAQQITPLVIGPTSPAATAPMARS